MKNLLKKRIPLLLTIILGLGLTLGAVYFMYYKRDERLSNLTTGLIKLDFKEKSNVIKLNDDVPVVDAAGLQRTPYTFTVENIGQKTINLNIKVDVKQNTNIPLGAVRYAVYINDKLVKKDYIHDDKILYTYEELLVNEIIECKLRFWIDYYYDQENKEFEALIEIEGESRDTGNEGITVTFDANGGTVDTTTKAVTVGENYGRLPIPTREGYTFKGWNGKNLFNMNEWLNSFNGAARGTINKSNNSITLTATGYDSYTYTYNNLGGYVSYKIPVKSKTTYILSWKSNNQYVDGNVYVFINDKTSSDYSKATNQKSTNLAFTTTSDAKFITFRVGVLYENDTITYSNIQLEEVNTATPYEPYYITNDTKVVQNGNHTLKAIWEENS